jgi:cholesterol transport system auxiliary component
VAATVMSAVRRQRARVLRALLAGLLACALLADCGGGRLRDLHFALQPEVHLQPSQDPIPGTLRVLPLTAQGFVSGSRIVYRTAAEPQQVMRYGELLWEEVPATAIANALVAALRAARVVEHVVPFSDPARAEFLLAGELVRFEHRPTDNPPHVYAEMSLTLVCGRNREVLVARSYAGEEPNAVGADGRTRPEAIIAAFDRLTGRLIGEIVADAQGMTRRCDDAVGG